jgi:hypothetical protein
MKNADTETTKAAIEMPSDNQPRISLVLFWRRFTSISVRNQSPVPCFQPDQCSASCSSDIDRNCIDEKVGFDDITAPYLNEVVERWASIDALWLRAPDVMKRAPDLSPMAHLLAIDVPKLVAFARVHAVDSAAADEVSGTACSSKEKAS